MSLFLLGVILVTTVLAVGYQGTYTLRVLDAVERDRDRWQQPAEVIESLELKEGSIVADIGSGAGYFTLKVAPIAGEHGGVFAVDILNEPLAFLWIRAMLKESTKKSGVWFASCCKIRSPVKASRGNRVARRLKPNVFRGAFRLAVASMS